jgi:glycosyltransferase involved in cell wall biosynthesis
MDGQRVFILMACYNGARYINEQIRSVQAQHFNQWSLIVRDDGSCDDTVQIIRCLAQEDSRIHLLDDGIGNLGVIGNFSVLMQCALDQGADYIFLADQDDVWNPEKLGVMLAAMRELEVTNGSDLPLLVHCDLVVVDEQKRMIASSFANYMKLSPARVGLGILLVRNQVTGCACLVNRAALELACPIPSGVFMHDWWLTLLCAMAGKIGYVTQPLMQYRQHATNVVGAKSYWRSKLKLLYSLDRWHTQMSDIRHSILQAGLVRERLLLRNAHLDPAVEQKLAAYANLLKISSLRRLGILKTYSIYKSTCLASLAFKLLLVIQHRDEE